MAIPVKSNPAPSITTGGASPESAIDRRWVVALRAALIIAAGLWVYAPAFHGGWMWDDDLYVTANPLLRTSVGLWSFWFRPGSWVEYYPIHETLLWVEWHLFGMDTLGYHLVTVALHLGNALLVWRLLAKLGLPKAWLGGLLFAVHPACVDSVAWIAETKNTVSMLPLLLAMCAWVDYEKSQARRDYARALVLFVVAMLGKISVSPFPLVILLFAWWKRGRINRRDWIGSAPFFAVSISLSLVSLACEPVFFSSPGRFPEYIPLLSWPARVALGGQSISVYFAHFFWPVHLLPVYSPWKIDPSSPIQFLPWLVLAGAFFYFWRKRATWGRHVLFGTAFFLIFLGPFIGLMPKSYMNFTWVMDHFLYVPIVGLIGLTVAALDQVDARLPAQARTVVTGMVTVLVTLLAFGAHAYAGAYADEITLWSYTIDADPDSWLAQDNLAKALLRRNHPAEAVPHFQAALKFCPGPAQIHFNLGHALAAMNRIDEALAEYDLALMHRETDADVYTQKGVSLLQARRLPEALAQFQQALRLRPSDPIALGNLGVTLAQSNRLPEALDAFAAAVRADPTNISFLANYGSALLASGRKAEAATQFERVLQIDPNNAMAARALERLR